MFFGEFSHTLDSKGRLTIPARFRHDFDDGLIVTRGLDGCLSIYTMKAWADHKDKILQHLPQESKNGRSYMRYLYANADKLAQDKQGRIILPPRLREYAEIESDVVVIGVEDRLEVWSPERWQTTLQGVERDAEQIAEELYRSQLQVRS